MSRQISTVLNVLFSIFGVAFAAYYASSSSGYSRETGILLGIAAGIVAGIADAGLIWIYSTRLDKDRQRAANMGARLAKGSGALAKPPETDAHVDGSGGDPVHPSTSSIVDKRTIRLRRRGLQLSDE